MIRPIHGIGGAAAPSYAGGMRETPLNRPGRIAPLFLVISCALGAGAGGAIAGQNEGESVAAGDADRPTVIEMDHALSLPRGARAGGRSPIQRDLIEHQRVMGEWTPPKEGDAFTAINGDELTWTWMDANDDGWIADRSLAGGYVSWRVELPEPRIMLLEAAGHSVVHVNGAPRGGDPYGYGWGLLPVALEEGENELLFAVGRGRVRAKLIEPTSTALFRTNDATLPDLIIGEPWAVRGAVLVVNAQEEAREAGELVIRAGGGELPVHESALPRIESLTMRKVSFTFGGAVDPDVDRIDLPLALVERSDDGTERVLDRTTVGVRVRRPNEKHKRTFISGIDGSVQYYAVTPPPSARATGAAGDDAAPGDDAERPALVLTLHGASVEAMGQANAYGRKDWAYIVAPTNRRPYGFDWEEWGRIDAMEVLEQAQRRFDPDPSRLYLTGHSMGGHGAWQVGATLPCRWAAIGPSAGWISFQSYGGAPQWSADDPREAVFQRVHNPSNTLGLKENFLHYGIYILHGDADDNVPVSEARAMREQLADMHPDVAYHEEPGAGHWWGNRCVDWPAMFEFFRERRRPAMNEVDSFAFVTANPGVSDRCHWARILQQETPYEFSRIEVELDREAHELSVATENIRRFAVDLSHLASNAERPPITVRIDGAEGAIAIDPSAEGVNVADLEFRHGNNGWALATEPIPANERRPERTGPFKHAFDNEMVLVYATQGTPEENAWAKAKAIFDAETWWYRGNGSVDILPDTRFVEQAGSMRNRNVILYGHRSMNAAWQTVLGEDETLVVDRGLVRSKAAGRPAMEEAELAVIAVRPRSDSERALVGVVAGTGVVGLRLTDRLPYFVSGVQYADLTILDSAFLTHGLPGIRSVTTYKNAWDRGTAMEFHGP